MAGGSVWRYDVESGRNIIQTLKQIKKTDGQLSGYVHVYMYMHACIYSTYIYICTHLNLQVPVHVRVHKYV